MDNFFCNWQISHLAHFDALDGLASQPNHTLLSNLSLFQQFACWHLCSAFLLLSDYTFHVQCILSNFCLQLFWLPSEYIYLLCTMYTPQLDSLSICGNSLCRKIVAIHWQDFESTSFVDVHALLHTKKRGLEVVNLIFWRMLTSNGVAQSRRKQCGNWINQNLLAASLDADSDLFLFKHLVQRWLPNLVEPGILGRSCLCTAWLNLWWGCACMSRMTCSHVICTF